MSADRHQIPPFGFRPSPELRAKLQASADKNGRSLNAELIVRLEVSLASESQCSTLRDELAGKALAAMIAQPDKEGANRGANGVHTLAAWAYEYADAMLKARSA